MYYSAYLLLSIYYFADKLAKITAVDEGKVENLAKKQFEVRNNVGLVGNWHDLKKSIYWSIDLIGNDIPVDHENCASINLQFDINFEQELTFTWPTNRFLAFGLCCFLANKLEAISVTSRRISLLVRLSVK